MEYEYMSEHFDDKYDLKKEGENIVIKITEGVWTDGNFIELTDTNSIGYEVERSMVQYVVATWKPMTFTYWEYQILIIIIIILHQTHKKK